MTTATADPDVLTEEMADTATATDVAKYLPSRCRSMDARVGRALRL